MISHVDAIGARQRRVSLYGGRRQAIITAAIYRRRHHLYATSSGAAEERKCIAAHGRAGCRISLR